MYIWNGDIKAWDYVLFELKKHSSLNFSSSSVYKKGPEAVIFQQWWAYLSLGSLFPSDISHLEKLGLLANMAGFRSGAGKAKGNMETSCGRQQESVLSWIQLYQRDREASNFKTKHLSPYLLGCTPQVCKACACLASDQRKSSESSKETSVV